MGIEDKDEAIEEAAFLEDMERMSEQFSELCQVRHEAGAAEYGVFTFMENDVIRMMAEELADTANYCRMQFVKLMMLNNLLVEEINDKGLASRAEEASIGIKAFKGTKTGWGGKE